MGRWQRRNLHGGAALFLLLAFFMPAPPALAAMHEITVVGIGVDSERGKAYEKAVDYGKKRAIYLLARKLGAVESERVLAKLRPDELHDMVRGFAITDRTRREDTTYLEMKVTILDTPLRKVLGLPPAEEDAVSFRRRGILVLPVFVEAPRPLLWEKRNPLTQPLKSLALKIGKGSIVLPVGDPEDLRVVDYNNVLTVDYKGLGAMVERYGATEVLVAVVTPGLPDTAAPTDILLRRLTKEETRLERITLPPKNALEKNEVRIQAAVQAIAQVANELSSSVAIQEREQLASTAQLPITFSFITMREFGEMQAALRSYRGFKQLILPSSGLHKVKGTLYYDGKEKNLRAHLKKSAIFIRIEDEGWVLSMR
jgi:hypothetical protein